MMFRSALLSLLLSEAVATRTIGKATSVIPASSTVGNKILSKARLLSDDVDYSWIVDYSIQFEECYSTVVEVEDEDGDDGDGFALERIVQFKLCPSDTCGSSTDGCADYIVDMYEFVDAYTENKMDKAEYDCEQVRENCDCDGDDDGCENQCYEDSGYKMCGDDYDGGDDEMVQEYLECAEAEFDEEEEDRRLDEEEEEEVQYFIGPTCSEDGLSIYLALFTDDSCSTPADSGTYETLSNGATLPYSSESLVENECQSCIENRNGDGDEDEDDEDEVIQMCEELYEDSGKCESNLAIDYPDEDSCYYINTFLPTSSQQAEWYETHQFESSKSESSGLSGGVKAALALLAIVVVLLAGCVCFMNTKIARKNVDLSSQGDSALA